jgi:hypothetical protein
MRKKNVKKQNILTKWKDIRNEENFSIFQSNKATKIRTIKLRDLMIVKN